MKRVLVIAYYFPPMGLSGVQRIVKFVKYLPSFGWKPTVLTVDPGGYYAFDHSLESDIDVHTVHVERTKSLDPTRIFKKRSTVAMPGDASQRWMASISQFLFIPDNKIGWYPYALKSAIALHAAEPFDAVFASAPPYTVSLIAKAISKRTGVPYVVDFRDDWIDNPRHKYPTFLHRGIHRLLEKKSMASAHAVVTINKQIANAIKQRHATYFDGKTQKPEVFIIPQGYDGQDLDVEVSSPTAHFTLLYSGVFYGHQTADFFLKGLALFRDRYPQEYSQLKASFVGLLPDKSKQLVEDLHLQDVAHMHGYLQHKDVVTHLKKATVLWMTVGKGIGQHQISTSKLYEYFGARKPVLGLVPEGAARDALIKYGASWVVEPDDVEAICSAIRKAYGLWQKRALPRPHEDYVASLDRYVLTGRLSALLDGISSG